MSVYEKIMAGLNEAVEHAEGKRKLQEVTLTVQPLKTYKPQEIKAIRQSIGASQSLFAGIMGVSIKTVEAWEAGRNQPEGPSRRLLAMIQSDPQTVEKYSIVAR